MGYSQIMLLSSSPAVFFVGYFLKKLHITKVVYNFSYMYLTHSSPESGKDKQPQAFTAHGKQEKTGLNVFRDSQTVVLG
jgi:hypothetical protein